MSHDEIITFQGHIGLAAGQVWRHLEEHGETTLAKLKKAVKPEEGTVEMAVGWLAREGKLSLRRERRSVKVALK